MDEASARPGYQLLQDEAILFNASQSEDFDDEQGEEEAYSNDEDEDTDSMFGYDEVDRDNSEVTSNQAEADENHCTDRASKMRDESDTSVFIEFLELLCQLYLTISIESFAEG